MRSKDASTVSLRELMSSKALEGMSLASKALYCIFTAFKAALRDESAVFDKSSSIMERMFKSSRAFWGPNFESSISKECFIPSSTFDIARFKRVV